MKKKSPTPYFRRPTEPNQRIQDGIKHPLLCPSCEDMFSKWETQFSNKVFQPIYAKNNPSHRFTYDEWLLKFAVSVSWRSLACLIEEYPQKELHKKVDPTLRAWSDYLLEKSDHISPYDQHILVMDLIENEDDNPKTSEINTFLKAGICFDTVHSDKNAYIFSKVCSILLVGVIYETEHVWQGTQIQKRGEYGPDEFTVPRHVASFLNGGVDMMLQGRTDSSLKQSEVIGNRMKK